MRRKILTYILLLLVVALLAFAVKGLRQYARDKSKKQTEVTTEQKIDESLYYTYGEVETFVGYLANTASISQSLARLVDPLNKSQLITVKYVKDVVAAVGVQEGVYQEILQGLEDSDYVTKEDFDAIYGNIVDTGRVKNLLRKDVFVMTVQPDRTKFYDGRDFYTADYEIAPEYEGKLLDVYMKNGTIFKTNGLSLGTVLLENVWVNELADGTCHFLYGAEEKCYPVSDSVSLDALSLPAQTEVIASDTDATRTDASPMVYESEGFVADLLISNEGITQVLPQLEVVSGRVLAVTDNGLQIEGMGTIPVSEDYRIYNVYENPENEESATLLTGYRSVNLYKKNNQVATVVINDKLLSETIRVIITSDDSSYESETVSFTCNSDYRVTYPDGHSITFGEGKSVTLNCEDFEKGDVITVAPKKHTGRVQLLSVVRECGNPQYDGVMEFDCQGDYFYTINELSMERYLFNVVANIAQQDAPEETLKAVAVCARAYAYTKLLDGSYEEYNAHLDDTSLCQVYNNVPATEASIRAVKDTYGLVPVYEKIPIVPLMFQVSYGMTCTNAEIWGGEDYPYLISNVENIDATHLDLSEESDFAAFLQDSSAYEIIDRDSPFYRWTVRFDAEEISKSVEKVLEERKEFTADTVLVKNSAGEFAKGDFTDLGEITDIRVTERNASGLVVALEIEGTNKTIQVKGQTNLRVLLSPAEQEIVRQDGSVLTGWTSLPSPFYYVEKDGASFVVHGGGFGHGAGMSLYGAGALARKGKNYKYILRHYYAYVDFQSIYDTSAED